MCETQTPTQSVLSIQWAPADQSVNVNNACIPIWQIASHSMNYFQRRRKPANEHIATYTNARAAIENLMCFALSLKVDLVLNCCARSAFISFSFFFHFFHVKLSLSLSLSFLFLFASSRSTRAVLFPVIFLLFLTRSTAELSAWSQFNFKCFLWSEYRNGKLWCLNDLVEFVSRFIFVAVNRHICKCESKTMQKWMIEMLRWRETNPRTIAIWDMFRSWLTTKVMCYWWSQGKQHTQTHAQVDAKCSHYKMHSFYCTLACVFWILFSHVLVELIIIGDLWPYDLTKRRNFGHESTT